MPFLTTIEGQYAFGRQPATAQPSGIVTSNLLLYLDAGNLTSYSGSGTTWTDLSSNTNNATSLTGTTYSSRNNGNLFFNGTSGSGSLVASKYNTVYSGKTVFVAAYLANALSVGQYRAFLGDSIGNRNFNFYLYSPSSGTYQLHFSSGGNGTLSSNIPYTVGTWFTTAVTQQTDGTINYYFNGVVVNTTSQSFSQFVSGTTEWVGRADNYWYGSLQVITVYNTALTTAQILQNHNAVLTRYPVTSNLVFYFDPSLLASYPGSGTTITDLSTSPATGTLSNITFTTPYFSYNGSSSQISISDNSKLEPGSGNWTMEAWFYPTQFKTGVILGKFNNGGLSANVSYSIRMYDTGVVYAQIGDGTGSYVNSTSYQSVLSNWIQVVYVIKNTAPKTLETFVNGSSIGSVPYPLSSILNSSNAFYIGSYNGGEYSQWYTGRIGITRLYNAVLTSAQVLQNYNADRATYGI